MSTSIPFGVLVRVQVVTHAGLFAADLHDGGKVEVLRWSRGAGFEVLGEGTFVRGEILGMPGASVMEERVYAALEAGLDAYVDASLV